MELALGAGARATERTLARLPRTAFDATALRAGVFAAISTLPAHELGPGLHLVAHRRLGRALARGRLDQAVLLDVAAEVAMEAHPVAAVAGQALLALPEVLQVV